MQSPFDKTAATFSSRGSEAEEFYNDLLPGAGEDDRLIIRQAVAGMIWSKQFYNYDLARWLDGDLFPPLQYDPHWKDLRLFNEYFHGETGLGLGAAHQTGWTGLVANLISRHYRKDIPAFWQRFW